MSLRLLLILSALLGGCATGRADAPPTCDGRDRRPANPHGSILVASTPAAPPASAAQPNPSEPSAGGCA
ncbi:MAG: hypothetical protein V7678_12295 [Brevundimonas sp.]